MRDQSSVVFSGVIGREISQQLVADCVLKGSEVRPRGDRSVRRFAFRRREKLLGELQGAARSQLSCNDAQ